MLSNIIVLLFTLCAVNAAPKFESRIVGGTEAVEGEYPYVVSLRVDGKHTCGASILNEEWVLTSGTCVDGKAEEFQIQYGIDITTSDNIIQVAEIIRHVDFSPGGSYRNDIAVLRLAEKIPLSPNTQPVQLAESNDVPGENPDAVLVGWGIDYDGNGVKNILNKVTLTLFNDNYCSAREYYYRSTYHVCAGIEGGGKGQCVGDAGGPLTVNNKQFGIASWSVKPCGWPDHPGIYTKVTAYREWIRKQTGL